jgi:hypothetical protein
MKESVKKSLLRQMLRNATNERDFVATAMRRGVIDTVTDGIEYLKKNPLKKRNRAKKQD